MPTRGSQAASFSHASLKLAFGILASSGNILSWGQETNLMHDTAMISGREFFKVYGKPNASILDVGSLDVNGSLRTVRPADSTYIGCDVARGPGVDIVLENPYFFPWTEGTFDLVVSTSCFEHTEFFWETFAEMARVTRPGGFIYVSAPVQGPVHRHPVDCWRFYPDAGKALAKWATMTGFETELLESFWLPPLQDQWVDFVGVWGRVPHIRPQVDLSSRFPQATQKIV